MKLKEIYDELLSIAKQTGYIVRKEKGSFHSGNCVLKEQKMIILNKNSPLEVQTGVVAKSFGDDVIQGMYLKPVIRDYIENELVSVKDKNFELDVNIPEKK